MIKSKATAVRPAIRVSRVCRVLRKSHFIETPGRIQTKGIKLNRRQSSAAIGAPQQSCGVSGFFHRWERWELWSKAGRPINGLAQAQAIVELSTGRIVYRSNCL